MKTARTIAVGIAALATVFVAACGQQTNSAADPSTAIPSNEATPTMPPEPGSGFGTNRVVYPPGRSQMGGELGPVGTVSVTHHDGYDQVVWEFTGPGEPQYAVEYVDQPVQEGSGDPVDVAGDAYLQVSVSSVSYPESPGQNSPQPAPADQLEGTVVAEAGAIDGGFEGYGMTWIGVSGQQRPFRVSQLTNPTRIVVDVVNTP